MKWRENGRGKSWVVWQTLHSHILVHRIGLTQGSYQAGILKNQHQRLWILIFDHPLYQNQLSSVIFFSTLLLYFSRQCGRLLVWRLNWLQHILVHSRQVMALESWVMTIVYDPKGILVCMQPMVLALGFQYMSLTMLMVVIVSLPSWDKD